MITAARRWRRSFNGHSGHIHEIYLFSLFLEELLVKFCDVQIQNVHKNSRTEP